jgi:hypothetical protein
VGFSCAWSELRYRAPRARPLKVFLRKKLTVRWKSLSQVCKTLCRRRACLCSCQPRTARRILRLPESIASLRLQLLPSQRLWRANRRWSRFSHEALRVGLMPRAGRSGGRKMRTGCASASWRVGGAAPRRHGEWEVVCRRPVHVNNAAGFEQSGCVHLPYAMYSSSAEEGSMWAPFANDWATTCPTYPGE